jgi:CTP synthase
LEESTVVIVPGGFGRDGIQTKLNAITYCRENNKPILGICLGMQLMILEYAKNVMGLDAITEELMSDKTDQTQTQITVVGFLDNWIDETDKKISREKSGDKGGTMRLGNYTTLLRPNTKTHLFYNTKTTVERHRHRYEVKLSPEILNRNGLTVSGSSKDGIPEIVEITDHPYFIGCQFHPEYRSTPFTPRPLFIGLLQQV